MLGALAALGGVAAVGCEESKPAVSSDSPASPRAARRAEVIVVGAGVAGLAAARDLVARDISTIVLEGRDRVGGRVWTDRSLGTALDVGASWIHGVSANPITDLAKEVGAKTAKTDYGDVHLWDHDGRRLKDSEAAAIASGWEELQSEIEAEAGRLEADLSFQQAVDLALGGEKLSVAEKRQLDWVCASLEVAAAEDFRRLSLRYSGEGDELGGGDRLFPDGYDQIPIALAKGLDVRLRTKVTRIDHAEDGVRVATDSGAVLQADAVLVTLPLGVLKKGTVRFTPALPAAKQTAIDRLAMGVLNKVALVFPSVFWPTARDFLGFMSPQRGEFPVFMNAASFSRKPMLVAFTGGDFARGLEKLSDDDVVARALAVLRKMFGSEVPAPTGRVVARWGSDPFAYGSYANVPVGAKSSDHDVLAEPVGERLFFAGEATHRAFAGTVHGALLSGRREAARIVELAG